MSLTAIRTVRVLRPLRAINRIPSQLMAHTLFNYHQLGFQYTNHLSQQPLIIASLNAHCRRKWSLSGATVIQTTTNHTVGCLQRISIYQIILAFQFCSHHVTTLQLTPFSLLSVTMSVRCFYTRSKLNAPQQMPFVNQEIIGGVVHQIPSL